MLQSVEKINQVLKKLKTMKRPETWKKYRIHFCLFMVQFRNKKI